MARSFKKVAGWKDHANRKVKRFASKAVRRYTGDLDSGGSYKKLFESWDICDYKSLYYTKAAARAAFDRYEAGDRYLSWHVYWCK